MKTLIRKCVLALFMASATLPSGAATPAPTPEQLARFYLPPDFMMLNGCLYYWQGFMPILRGRLSAALQGGADKRTTIKALLKEYDGIERAMCAEALALSEEDPESMDRAFRTSTYFSGGAMSGTIASPEAQRWRAANAAFARKSVHIPTLYYMLMVLGPEFINWEDTAKDRDASEKLRAAERDIKRCGAGKERKVIFLSANDSGFASMLPSYYDLPALAREEAHLRQECRRLGLDYIFGPPPTGPIREISDPADLERGLARLMKLNAMFERYKSRMQEAQH
jgi:hypothetical protein